jgi:DNA-binding GntR family transcriptional regulator
MAVRLRATGQVTDMVHRIVEALREEISAGALRGGSRITGEKELSAILRVSRSTLREALRILVHEGFLVSRWGVGTFVTDQLPSIVKGRTADVNVPLPLQWIEPHWTLLTDEETTIAADDVVAAALGIPPGENVCRRRRTYGISNPGGRLRDGRRGREPCRGPLCSSDRRRHGPRHRLGSVLPKE